LADRSAALDQVKLQGAFPEAHPNDFDMGQTGPDAQEISGPSEAHRPGAQVSRSLLSLRMDSRPLDVARAARLVSESPLPDSLPASPRSDVSQDAQLTQPSGAELTRDVPARHRELQRPAVPRNPLAPAREQPVSQELGARRLALGRPASAGPPQEPASEPMSEPGEQFSPWLPRFSLLPPLPLPPPSRGNVSSQAQRARYRSSWSVSSSPGRRSQAGSR
jgi:hypothetical protein